MSEYKTMDILETDNLRRETLLESLSLQLMRENITQQIYNVTTSTTDFLGIIRLKFDAILEESSIDDDDKRDLKDQIIDFCQDLIQDISNLYNIAINLISDDYENSFNLLYTLYNFFVLNKYNNVEKFLLNYIDVNKTTILDMVGYDKSSDNITSISAKKRGLNTDCISVLSKLNEIINFVYTSNITEPREFIQLIDDGELYVHNMANYYDEQTIMGNFIPEMLSGVIGERYDGNELTRIRNTIRIYFYNKSGLE